jgi:hypothetical protein
MGKKFKCESSSSSNCNPCSSSSSSFVVCCKKYPTCKCAPIYYPNNCNPSPYPCNPCAPKYCPPYPCPPNPCGPYPPNPCGPYPPNPYNPCGPCPPYPVPCPPNQISTPYTSYNNLITATTTTLTTSSPNVNICNTPAGGISINLPTITSGCNKMFVISNLSTSSGNVTINTYTGSSDIFTSSTFTPLNAGDSVTLYSVFTSGGSYWVVA